MSAVIAMVAAWLVFQTGAAVLRRAVARSPSASLVTQSARRPAAHVLPLLALQFVLRAAPDDLSGIGLARQFTTIVLIAAVTWLVVRIVQSCGDAVILSRPIENISDNLMARRIQTQTKVVTRMVAGVVVLIGISLALMTIPDVRQIGTSLLASAGVAGIAAGLAARPVLGNLIAGLQIAFSQPIRLDDVVIVEGEWGRIEEITSTYVVVRIWDERRLIVPLQYWIEKPFQNWTRSSAQLLGTVFLWVDYRMPLQPIRDALKRVCEGSPLWDGRVCLVQVTDFSEKSMQLRCLVSTADSGKGWDLRCLVREELMSMMQKDYPEYLPRLRAEVDPPSDTAHRPPAPEQRSPTPGHEHAVAPADKA
ncbi:MAG: mechanosensitive ion channel domain-containing protein [Aquabacterium sp.]